MCVSVGARMQSWKLPDGMQYNANGSRYAEMASCFAMRISSFTTHSYSCGVPRKKETIKVTKLSRGGRRSASLSHSANEARPPACTECRRSLLLSRPLLVPIEALPPARSNADMPLPFSLPPVPSADACSADACFTDALSLPL